MQAKILSNQIHIALSRTRSEKNSRILTFPNVLIIDPEKISTQKAFITEKISQYPKLLLEVGCGKGEYTIAMARNNPEMLCMGIDLKGPRIHDAAMKGLEPESIENAFFLKGLVEHLDQILPHNTVDELWLPFSDPYPKKRHIKKRLVAPSFLDIHRNIIKPNGKLHLKTDQQHLYEYALESIVENGGQLIAHTPNLYASDLADESTGIKTTFEQKFLAEGITIKYICFQLDKKVVTP